MTLKSDLEASSVHRDALESHKHRVADLEEQLLRVTAERDSARADADASRAEATALSVRHPAPVAAANSSNGDLDPTMDEQAHASLPSLQQALESERALLAMERESRVQSDAGFRAATKTVETLTQKLEQVMSESTTVSNVPCSAL